MHIAQLSVAGEGCSRLQSSAVQIARDDERALDEYACDRSNLPWIIFRAAHRANHISALPSRARAVLAALARTVDAARPFAAIFARRELLTGRALQSMRTFYRSLEDLETAGFITRPPQTRYGGAGLFGRAYLHLTAKAAALLGLVDSHSDVVEASLVTNETANLSTPADSLAHPSVTVADGAIYKDLNPTSQKRQPGTLPADLTRLRRLGFREFLIFKLMREASAHGKRLSDVVEATWNHLQRAKRPINYLRALLRVPVDFAYRLRSLRSETVNRDTRQEADIELQHRARHLAGQTFESHDGVRRYFVAHDAQSITVQHRDEPRPRVHVGAWARDFTAAIDAGLIVAAPVAAPGPLRSIAHRATAVPELPRGGTSMTPQIAEHLHAMKRMLRLKEAGVDTISARSKESATALPITSNSAHSDVSPGSAFRQSMQSVPAPQPG